MSKEIIITFDEPGKVVDVAGVSHIVLVTAVRKALDTDLVLRNARQQPVGKIVDYGVCLGSPWVSIVDVWECAA